jgi:CheY-like chemotaxis protein
MDNEVEAAGQVVGAADEAEPLIVDVLVVEDEPELRDTVAELLDDIGLAVATAAHGGEALALVDGRLRPRLILLDLEMPVMDGWEFLRERKQRPELRATPIALFTSKDDEPIVRHQVDTRIEKPAAMKELLAAVQGILAERAPKQVDEIDASAASGRDR